MNKKIRNSHGPGSFIGFQTGSTAGWSDTAIQEWWEGVQDRPAPRDPWDGARTNYGAPRRFRGFSDWGALKRDKE